MIGSAPAFSVSDFVAVFNQSMDMLYPEVVITGELSNFRISKNMWAYFDLKDDMASVKFFGTVRALPGPLEDGMLLEVAGRPYLHPKFGFSIQVSSVRAVGDGSINKAYLMLMKKLEGEGLFDESRKRRLPYAPEKVAVVTSAESAAYGDFVKIIASRWPFLEFELFDSLVQGIDAPQQLVAAIKNANQTSSNAEALIIIRGGGSKDDLAAFDHESVVRAIAASRIPTLVAIGHERDISLSELAADARASTPSNAAELLVPDRKNELNNVKQLSAHLDSLISRYSHQLRDEVVSYKNHMNQAIQVKFSSANEFAAYAMKLLVAFDPKQPLKRGYALPRSADGSVVKTSNDAQTLQKFSLEFVDGIIGVEIKE